MSLERQIAQLANALREAKSAAALTGAGISTLSGIADFRSPDQEIWTRFEPTRVFDIGVFRSDPGHFHRFANEVLAPMGDIAPSEIHLLLAGLQQAGLLGPIATQNIDGLHQRAGSQDVFELHGGVAGGGCLACSYRMDGEQTIAFLRRPPTLPCPECGGILKPDVVFYGEQLPEAALTGAWKAAKQADLYLVLGSSLQVVPAAYLPRLATESGAKLVVINRDETDLDVLAWLVIRDDLRVVAEALSSALADELGSGARVGEEVS